MKKFLFIFTLFFLSFGLTLQPSWANHPCAHDAKQFCSTVSPGGGQLIKCLKKHKKEISPACHAKVKDAKKNLKKLRRACKSDRNLFCAEAVGGGNVINCLRAHSSLLTPKCRLQCQQRI